MTTTPRRPSPDRCVSIVGTLSVDAIIKDRAQFAASVKEKAEHSMTNQGLVIDTFQIKSVDDSSGYLKTLAARRPLWWRVTRVLLKRTPNAKLRKPRHSRTRRQLKLSRSWRSAVPN